MENSTLQMKNNLTISKCFRKKLRKYTPFTEKDDSGFFFPNNHAPQAIFTKIVFEGDSFQ